MNGVIRVAIGALVVTVLLVPGSPNVSAQPIEVRVGVADSGGTALPAKVITGSRLDERHGIRIVWTPMNPAAVQKGFALKQFPVSFAATVLDLVRQRARGDDVAAFHSAILSNNYVVVRKGSPYRSLGDLRGKKFGIYSWSSGSTAALAKIARERNGLDVQKDLQTIVAPPPALIPLLQKGDLEGMVNIDPAVLRILHTGPFTQILDLREAWQALMGEPLLISTLAVWGDYARANPDVIRRLVRVYRDAVRQIKADPNIYEASGFIADTGMRPDPEVKRLFAERFRDLYTTEWSPKLVKAQEAVFAQAIAMQTLEKVPADWYTFAHASE